MLCKQVERFLYSSDILFKYVVLEYYNFQWNFVRIIGSEIGKFTYHLEYFNILGSDWKLYLTIHSIHNTRTNYSFFQQNNLQQIVFGLKCHVVVHLDDFMLSITSVALLHL